MRIILQKAAYYLLRPILGAPADLNTGPGVDIYASKMMTEFNWLHDKIYPRFFSKIKVDADSIKAIKERLLSPSNYQPIYVTTFIGQLEYNYFNYLFLTENLPLADHANELTNQLWMPFGKLRQTIISRLAAKIDSGGTLAHPVSSGYIEKLLIGEKSIMVRLKTTTIHDDLYWDIPEEDFVQVLITTQKKMSKELLLIPQQFLWAKRPEARQKSVIDWIFGEREAPGRIRKTVLFWRNYKRDAVVQFGEPISLKEFIDAHPSISDAELARILRNALLSQIREERKRITGPALKPRRWIIDTIMESPAVERAICEIATEKEKDIDDVRTLARRYVKEIAADVSYTYIEYCTRLLNWVFNSMYDGVQLNQENLPEIKKLVAKAPVVFVPSHRSHVDYLLLSGLLYDNNISIPHVAAGINLSFWPLGKIFRRCGAFFLRRTFSGNRLYKAVFETYLRLLIREGYCQEFFIEGGRSRTGKLRQPMMGMLSMYTHAMLDKTAQELVFIPTSVTYDKVVEESSYISESSGSEKKKEKFTDILKLHKYAKRRYGKIYVHFGRPILFSEVSQSISGSEGEGAEANKIKIVEKIAYEIMKMLNDGTFVTPSALTSTAFLMECRRGTTTQELFENVDLIRSYLQYANVGFANTLISEPHNSILETIRHLISQKTIEFHDKFEPVCYVVPEEKRFTLDFQKNLIIHFLLPVAYISAAGTALIKGKRNSFTKDDLLKKADFLSSLFSMEFTAQKGFVTELTLNAAIEFLARLNIIDLTPDKISVTALGVNTLARFKAIIDNLIESYKIAYYTCVNIPLETAYDEKHMIKTMFEYGRHLTILGQVRRPEAISKPAFENAIRLFKHIGLLNEEPMEKASQERPKYCLNRSSSLIKELQQELEVFS